MTEISLTADTRYGSMDILREEGDIVSRFLLRYGEWSEFEIQFVSANLRDSAKVADVGAFVGSFGIGLSQSKRLGQLVFIEANPEVVPLLRRNVERNCRATHEVLDALLFPAGREAKAVRRHGANQGSISYDPESDAEIAPDVPLPKNSIGLVSLLMEHGPFDLVKLDIEGLELEVLKDIEAELSGGEVAIWAECNEALASLQLAEFLLSCGLRVHYFAFPSFNPDNFRGDKEAIFPFAYEAGLYASRAAPAFPDALRQAGCVCHEIKDAEGLRRALWQTPRWCPSELFASHLEESLAIAIRYLSGEHYTKFLAGAEAAKDPTERRIATPLALSQALESVEHQLRTLSSEQDALKRELRSDRHALECERETHIRSVNQLNAQIALERELGLQQTRLAEWAETLAHDRLGLLRAERQLRLDAMREFAELTSRRSWRAMNLMVRSMARYPALYRVAQSTWIGSRHLARFLRIKT
jgi:FkbM family methyltransferase